MYKQCVPCAPPFHLFCVQGYTCMCILPFCVGLHHLFHKMKVWSRYVRDFLSFFIIPSSFHLSPHLIHVICHVCALYMLNAWIVTELHLHKKKNRHRCYTESPTAQDEFQSIIIPYQLPWVTGRWGLLCHELIIMKGAVRWLGFVCIMVTSLCAAGGWPYLHVVSLAFHIPSLLQV